MVYKSGSSVSGKEEIAVPARLKQYGVATDVIVIVHYPGTVLLLDLHVSVRNNGRFGSRQLSLNFV